MNNITLVTGLWDIGRGDLKEGWSRSFEHYIEKFKELLKVEENMIIFGDAELEKIVFSERNKNNTQFILRDLNWFKNNEYYQQIQKIRTNPDWHNLSGWLIDSTQSKLEMYNPLVMSKMFLLNDAKIMDTFNSEHMFWIDAGITNTVHYGYFTHDKVLNKLPKYIKNFSFVCFPYDAETEIHGFEYSKLNQIANSKVSKVARGGFFGGLKESISPISALYYDLLLTTLNDGYMGTEESIFSAMCYKHSDIINYFEIESNGLMSTFFENLKDDKLTIKSESSTLNTDNDLDMNNTALYVISFNSPKQFETLIESMSLYDTCFIAKPRKFLLDNSTDESTFDEYARICEEHNFNHIKKENLGICGGRQFIAEHADENNFDFYFFFEDDMFLNSKWIHPCKNGFSVYLDNFYYNTLNIIKKNNYDFLKLSFTEFYGDNSTQWAWYNVPQSFRVKNWPDKPNLPISGLDPNAPKTKFNNIKSYNGIPFADGEIYYCNWPQIVSKYGNRKMFLTDKWTRPFEQTWMSYIYQQTISGNIKPAILLSSPISHNRFEHYSMDLRKES
jgi:hypothetical protein